MLWAVILLSCLLLASLAVHLWYFHPRTSSRPPRTRLDRRSLTLKPQRAQYLQPIFLPNAESVKAHLDVLRGFQYYDEQFPNTSTVDVFFGGWAASEALWQEYLGHWNRLRPNRGTIRFAQNEPWRFPHNFGQAFLFSRLANTQSYPYIFLSNCDTALPASASLPSLHLNLNLAAHDPAKCGCVAFNLAGQNVHLDFTSWPEQLVTFHGPHEFYKCLLARSEVGGIALAVTVWSSAALDDIGGLRCRGVYSSDDGEPLQLVQQRGWHCYINTSTLVYHPPNLGRPNPRFVDWKARSLAWSTQPERPARLTEQELLPWALEAEKILAET